ncbi:MAG: hypothetical protein K2K56_00155 [Lachnospiraceae bacterium]|nr:hypothetical protein [Lachnospiraceae bacterium]
MTKPKYDKIKYDKMDKKRNFIAAILFSILAVMNWCVLNCEAVMQLFPVEIEVVFLCAVWPLGLLTVGLWMAYLDGVLYLKRLKRFGYVVPEDKNAFDKALAQLPREENATGSKPVKNYDSIALTVLTGAIVIGLLVYDICFLYQYSGVGNDIWFFEGLLILGTLIWLFLGISYARQISNRRYKYDVEIDYSRKNRRNLIDGIVEIIVLLVFTFPSIAVINNVVQYMIKAREGR